MSATKKLLYKGEADPENSFVTKIKFSIHGNTHVMDGINRFVPYAAYDTYWIFRMVGECNNAVIIIELDKREGIQLYSFGLNMIEIEFVVGYEPHKIVFDGSEEKI